MEKGMEELRKSIAEAEEKIKTYDTRVQNAPKSEQELQDVLRENIELNKRYQEMSDSLNKAQISQSLETRQQVPRFESPILQIIRFRRQSLQSPQSPELASCSVC